MAGGVVAALTATRHQGHSGLGPGRRPRCAEPRGDGFADRLGLEGLRVIWAVKRPMPQPRRSAAGKAGAGHRAKLERRREEGGAGRASSSKPMAGHPQDNLDLVLKAGWITPKDALCKRRGRRQGSGGLQVSAAARDRFRFGRSKRVAACPRFVFIGNQPIDHEGGAMSGIVESLRQAELDWPNDPDGRRASCSLRWPSTCSPAASFCRPKISTTSRSRPPWWASLPPSSSLIIVARHIDLSVGSVMGFVGVLIAYAACTPAAGHWPAGGCLAGLARGDPGLGPVSGRADCRCSAFLRSWSRWAA